MKQYLILTLLFLNFTVQAQNLSFTGNLSQEIDSLNTVTSSISVSREVVVKTALDLYGTLSSNVEYVIDGVIDLDTVEIIVPEGGLFLRGIDYFVSGLISTNNNHTMFKNGIGDYSGNLKMSDIYITSSGTGSKVFNLDNQENFGAIEISSCNIGDFSDSTTSLGELSNYRQFRVEDVGFFRNQDGLAFSGIWAGGFRINDAIVLSLEAGSTLFKSGTGLTFAGRCISDINAASVDPTTTIFDFSASNFLLNSGFQLSSASFPPNSNTSISIDETSTKVFFHDCTEIRNTAPGFQMDWATDIETPLTLNTPIKALGTTVTTHNVWFTQTGDNEVTYNSTVIKDLRVSVNITIDGGANNDIAVIIRKWNNSLSAYEDLKSKVKSINNSVGGSDVVDFSFIVNGYDFNINDRIEVFLENKTNNTNCTVLTGSELIVDVI